MNDVLRVLAVLALVAGNAFFVIGEYAVVTARRSALAPRAEAGHAGARAALRLMNDPVRVISTVQVGITAIGILTGAVGEPLVRDLLGEGVPTWVGFIIAFSVVTYLSAVFGELVPKALTLDRAETLAALAGEGVRSVAELEALVDEAEGAGVIPRAQEELLHNVFGFATQEAADVMIPAPDVGWLDAGLTPEAALDQIAERAYSRYPPRPDGVTRRARAAAGRCAGDQGPRCAAARAAREAPAHGDRRRRVRRHRRRRHARGHPRGDRRRDRGRVRPAR